MSEMQEIGFLPSYSMLQSDRFRLSFDIYTEAKTPKPLLLANF